MGITGVSYGGFLTCLAVGYDDRYAFAAPVYGCLSNAEGAGEFGSYIRNNEGADLWDDTGALAAGNAPILFVNSDTDTHFTLDSMARCIRAAKYGAGNRHTGADARSRARAPRSGKCSPLPTKSV